MSGPQGIPESSDPGRTAASRGHSRNRWIGLTALVLAVVLTAFLVDFVYLKNFSVVAPGQLYRSGQPSEEQLDRWIREFGLKSIISLRHTLPLYEQNLARKHGVKLHHLTFSAKTGLGDRKWQRIREILVNEDNYPLLVHCRSGADRTGQVIALYRIELQGWPLDKALREMYLHYHLPAQYPVLQQEIRARCSAEEDEAAAVMIPE